MDRTGARQFWHGLRYLAELSISRSLSPSSWQFMMKISAISYSVEYYNSGLPVHQYILFALFIFLVTLSGTSSAITITFVNFKFKCQNDMKGPGITCLRKFDILKLLDQKSWSKIFIQPGYEQDILICRRSDVWWWC